MSFFSCSYNFFRWTKVGNHTRFLDTQNIANQREVNSLGGDLYPTVFAPPFGTPRTVIFCRFLRSAGKQKIPISFGNQDFTAFCFSSKWCHQESNRGHKDFQSFALPTELWHHRFCVCKDINNFIFAQHFVGYILIFFIERVPALSF